MNYLGEAAYRITGRVGFRGNPQARRKLQGQQGEEVDDPIDNYSYNSGLSAPGTTNLLAAWDRRKPKGGERKSGSEPTWEGQPLMGIEQHPQRDRLERRHRHPQQRHGNGGGGDQGTVQDEGQPHNEQGQGGHQGPGGAIAA